MVYATWGLVTALLELAADAEPDALSVALAVTPAAELEGASGAPPDSADVPADAPVLTHFYPPDAGESLNAVFGVDLSIPAGQTQGRFVSHPDGNLGVTKADDLARAVLVAVPPWEESSLAAFDRSGRRQPLEVVDAEPPVEEFA
ncbi:MPN domain-containing protein [Halorussus amylolyticus]|uniref:hypothetical protein n=1 Tax=Halorussus amylolyticus TaxID=1126242 RepID=UPI001043502F|nr:hypothetical protein [Halorussus amylolyticus]